VGRIAVVLLALAALACRENGQTNPDGSSDGGKPDLPSTKTLQIAPTGCGDYDLTGDCDPDAGPVPCCSGRPPLALSFAPLGSPELTRFQWDFGDGTAKSSERAPSHTYAHPGRYEVSLIGGSSEIGTVVPPHALRVVVEPLAAGAACEVDGQCGAGLTCLCAPGRGCAPAFVRGFCSAACDTDPCTGGAVCAIAPAVAAATGTSAPRCLAACQTSAECAPGFVCQTFPAGPTAAIPSWTRGCFPVGAARDVGASCRDASGALADGVCAAGTCLDIGALGVCSAVCGAGLPCPDGTTCAALAGGRQLCLLTCGSDGDCARDPLLACAPARPMDSAPSTSVCRPRSCTTDVVCAPSGRCGPDGACVPG
jgi:hypothetical protein